jgi:probable F420-dependent oxidoreductase
MRIGVVYPQSETGGDPATVRAIGVAAEELGYDHLLAYDHVLGATRDREPQLTGPYDERDSFHDPLVMFGYLAALTTSIEFATGILILPQRQTALVARQAADVALLSGGRLRIGVGVGWNYVEYEALGQDFRTRGARLDEQMALLRRLWSEPVVSFDGRFDRMDRVALNPRPARSIPLWVGGFHENAYLRGATLGDGFVFFGRCDTCLAALARVRARLAETGRPIEGFGCEMIVHGRSPDDVARTIDWWARAGGTHASVRMIGNGLTGADAYIEYMARLRKSL